jgi:hypothetical protein
LKRIRLRSGQMLDKRERRAQQLVEAGERQLRLRLHSARHEHVHVVRALARVLEERALPDSGLTAEH